MLTLINRFKAHPLRKKLLPLSYSKAKTWHNCPRQFDLRYLAKVPQGAVPEPEPANVGGFVHKALELAVKERLGQDFDRAGFDRAWVAAAAAKPLTAAEQDLAEALRGDTAFCAEKVLGLVRRFGLLTHLEESFAVGFGNHVCATLPWPQKFFWGFLDVFGITPAADGLILDYKSHKQTPEHAADAAEQMRVYAYYMFLRYPELTRIQTACVYLPDRDFAFDRFLGRDELPSLEADVRDLLVPVLQGTAVGAFPATPGRHCAWCGYHDGCPEAR